ncbi:tyrosine-type recombinase/integrase [Lacticaseibacillus zhaodongensis]|uniref:tyrosine-type recombinase/integrase n=1 Tax=Lacticaseibacillus zhaodongensis TaxID=2668065 RepID=UPI001E3D4F66|nr:tyrosine-type recombinase/integrase [Lacticaseibacillus zhaodongensis]
MYLGHDPQTGKTHTVTRRNFATKRAAREAMADVVAQWRQGGQPQVAQSRTPTFQAVYDLWRVNYELTVKESTYVKTTEQFRVHVLPVFGPQPLDTITIVAVQQFINAKMQTYKKYRELVYDLSRIFEYGINLGLVTSNPTRRITVPKRQEDVTAAVRVNYYTRAELQEFMRTCREQQPLHVYAFFKLLSASGCRMGELLGLEWRNVDFQQQCIHIVQTLARGKGRRLYLGAPKTRNSRRTVSLDSETMMVLRQWQERQAVEQGARGFDVTSNPHQLVFANRNNSFIQLSKPRTWMLQNMHKNHLREITVHGFRHTHATLLLEAGVAPKIISERLGHRSIQITLDLYAHVTKRMETSVPSVFAAILADDEHK